jgi:hypothetical protein
MLRTSLLLVILAFGMLGCSKPIFKPKAKTPAKEVLNARSAEKAPKPSPYIYKAPRQVSATSRETVATRGDRPQPE